MRCQLSLVGAMATFLAVSCVEESALATGVDPMALEPVLSIGAAPVRPWHSVSAGSSYFGVPCGGPGLLTLVVDGDGTATHVGLFEVTIEGCYDLASLSAVGPTGGTITAADGDEIHLMLVDYQQDPATGTSVSVFSIDGGTGRFADADGEFTNTGVTYPDFSWANEGVGWISF